MPPDGIGRTLITANTTKIQARLLNVHDYDKKLRKRTTIGSSEEVAVVTNVKEAEELQQGSL